MSDEGLVQSPTRVQIIPPSGPEILRQAEMARKQDQDAVERMLSLPARRSETIGQLAEALSQAQGEMLDAERDSVNPHFKSRFASLASVRAACGPYLSKYKIAYPQLVRTSGRMAMVTTLFAHASGEWLEETIVLTAADDKPQTVGSAVTYGRRYGLAAMAGIAPADDDGEAASQHGPQGVRHDRANTPLQRATGTGVSDELEEGSRSPAAAPTAGQVPVGGTPVAPGAGAVPPPSQRPPARPIARPVGTGTPPPPGKPPARAPGSDQ